MSRIGNAIMEIGWNNVKGWKQSRSVQLTSLTPVHEMYSMRKRLLHLGRKKYKISYIWLTSIPIHLWPQMQLGSFEFLSIGSASRELTFSPAQTHTPTLIEMQCKTGANVCGFQFEKSFKIKVERDRSKSSDVKKKKWRETDQHPAMSKAHVFRTVLWLLLQHMCYMLSNLLLFKSMFKPNNRKFKSRCNEEVRAISTTSVGIKVFPRFVRSSTHKLSLDGNTRLMRQHFQLLFSLFFHFLNSQC